MSDEQVQPDEMTQEEFPVVLPLGDLIEERIDGGALDHPVQGQPSHDGGCRPLGERVEDRWEYHGNS